jgi:hypothetical protein
MSLSGTGRIPLAMVESNWPHRRASPGRIEGNFESFSLTAETGYPQTLSAQVPVLILPTIVEAVIVDGTAGAGHHKKVAIGGRRGGT